MSLIKEEAVHSLLQGCPQKQISPPNRVSSEPKLCTKQRSEQAFQNNAGHDISHRPAS